MMRRKLAVWATVSSAWFALMILPFAACTTVEPLHADCETPCGLLMERQPFEGWSCGDLIAAEARAVEVLDRATRGAAVPDARLQHSHACDAWAQVVVMPRAEEIWPDGARNVAGLAHCDRAPQLIEVTGRNRPTAGALAHELAHIAQGCWAGPVVDEGEDVAHANWKRAGVRAALAAFGG